MYLFRISKLKSISYSFDIGENIIGAQNMWNDYGAFKLLFFFNIVMAISYFFSFLLVKLSLLIFFMFGISSFIFIFIAIFKRYRSSNYCDSDNCHSCAILEAEAKSFPFKTMHQKLFSIFGAPIIFLSTVVLHFILYCIYFSLFLWAILVSTGYTNQSSTTHN